MPNRFRPTLRAFPIEDLGFRRYVAEVFARLVAETEEDASIPLEPEELQVRIRERYPSAVVRQRDSLADPAGGEHLWYVYRFGSVTPGRRWWEEPGHAWAILDESRRFVEVSTSLTAIAEVPREELLGTQVEALANPEDVTAPADVIALWDEIQRRGELHATVRFRRVDGTPREIEYHVTRDGAGPGRHLAVVREIDPS